MPLAFSRGGSLKAIGVTVALRIFIGSMLPPRGRQFVVVRLDPRLLQLALEELQVAAVGAKENVGDVARNGDGTDRGVEQQVAEHSRLQPTRCAELARQHHRIYADQRRGEVACDRDKA